MTVNELLTHLKGVSGTGKQFSAKCPAHDDKHQSLSVSEGADGRILLHCHAGCLTSDICYALGIKNSDLFQMHSEPQRATQNSKPKLVAEYVYTDLNGRAVAKKLRYSNKAFCWLKPDGVGGWCKGRNGSAPLYNQYAANSAECIYIVEGEKDVETLKRFNKVAVSLPDGAKSKWTGEYTNFFKFHKVAIIQDNDKPGKEFAQNVASHIKEVTKSLKVIDLSKIWAGIKEHSDVTDYITAHPSTNLNELSQLVANAHEWEPQAEHTGIINLSDVQSTSTKWLWKPYIPKGKITLMTADPGTGKTFFSLYLTAQVSTGRSFFGETQPCEPRTAVYQTAEDGIADTIKPRLEPMNPDFNKILVIDESNEALSLSDERIENVMKTYHPALMIFDPLQAYLGADVDMHRANEVRPILAQIGRLAEKYDCAVIFIMHNSKMGQNQALYRALGSIDIPAIARSMLIMGKNPSNPEQKVICHEKSSLAARGKSMLFRINPECGGIIFDGFSELTADEVLSPKKEGRNKPSVTKDQVTEELIQLLGEDDYVELEDVQALKEELGCGKETIYRAKRDLGLDTVSIGYSANRHTYWINSNVDKAKFKEEHKNVTSMPQVDVL